MSAPLLLLSLLLSLLLLSLLGACHKAPPQTAYALGSLGLEVRTSGPVATAMRDQEATLTLRPGARTPTELSLSAAPPGGAPPPGATSLPLAAPLQGSYTLTRSDGGSGGAEATLRGQIRGPTRRWIFTCHAQSESEHPEAECLSLLATLRPTSAP